MYVKAFIVNVNNRLKPFFLEHINIVTLQSVWFICTPALHNGNQTKTYICLVHYVHFTSIEIIICFKELNCYLFSNNLRAQCIQESHPF